MICGVLLESGRVWWVKGAHGVCGEGLGRARAYFYPLDHPPVNLYPHPSPTPPPGFTCPAPAVVAPKMACGMGDW